MALAQPEHIYRALATIPNDPLYTPPGRSSGLWHLPLVGAPEAWDVTTGSGGVGVCVIDTGARGTHSDLAPNIAGGWDRCAGAGPYAGAAWSVAAVGRLLVRAVPPQLLLLLRRRAAQVCQSRHGATAGAGDACVL